jgi:transposase
MKFGAGRARRCPRVLGIDEISLKKRHRQFALVLTDIERKCILDILPERSKEALEKWLDQFDERERKSVRYASIDMWSPYYHAVRRKLPKARIVVDRFHVVKHLNERITTIRRKYQKNAPKEIAEVLKGSRWILVRNRKDLSPKDEKKLKQVLEACPELRTIYLLKEEFRFIFERARDRYKAEKYLRVWKLKAMHTGNRFLLKFVKTLENWWNEILNYFLENITNGFVEGLNGALRAIIRRAFGYRNFQNFRYQALAEQNFPTN